MTVEHSKTQQVLETDMAGSRHVDARQWRIQPSPASVDVIWSDYFTRTSRNNVYRLMIFISNIFKRGRSKKTDYFQQWRNYRVGLIERGHSSFFRHSKAHFYRKF